MTRIGSIVEGHGEVEALPILFGRVFDYLGVEPRFEVERPVRVNRGRLLKPGELERYVQLLAGRVGADGCMMVLLDSDEDCPAEMAPVLSRRIELARGGLLFSVVLPTREFEAWLLASARSLAGARGLPRDLEPPPDPESVHGAKEWLGRQRGSPYVPTLDQPALTARLDVESARAASSFDKFVRECSRLISSGRPAEQ